MTKVSLKGLASREPLELLKLAYYINSQKLVDQFRKVQIEIENEEQLATLAEIINKKYDIDGRLKINGNPAIFDSRNILNSIRYSPEEKEKAKQFIDYSA